MKRIINGKIYNTNTAIRIAHWDNGKYQNYFNNYAYNSLYKTKKGQFFATGNAGFIAENEDEYCHDKQMVLLTKNQALEWIAYHSIDPDDIKDITEHFEMIEG